MNSLPKSVQALAVRLADARGTSVDEAVTLALEEALSRPTQPAPARTAEERADLICRLEAISRRAGSLPVLDSRSEDEILGYDEDGVPS